VDRSGVDAASAAEIADTSRLETFADGVMAIAITLLILEIDVPHLEGDGSLGAALARQWPSYAGYVVSFLTIGIIWVNHHHMFSVIERSTSAFLMLNVLFLMTIAALPWPTALVAEYIQDDVRRTAATMVYGGTMTAISVMFNVVWRYASYDARLLPRTVDRAALAKINRNYLAGPVVYSAATLLALVNPWISLVIFALLALYYLVPTSGPRPALLGAHEAAGEQGAVGGQ
jgi:uncharacterized membrane protein